MQARTLMLSEDFAVNSVLNSGTPGGLGAIQSPFFIPRALVGAAMSGIGFSGLVSGAGTALFNCNLSGSQPSLEIAACCYFQKFDSSADGNTACVNSIFASQTAITTGWPSIGTLGVGCMVVRGDGLLGVATNGGLVWSNVTLQRNAFYWFIFEEIPIVGGWSLFNVWVAAASGVSQAPSSVVMAASFYCTSNGADFAGYAGIRSGGESGGNGAVFQVTAYRMSSKTCSLKPQSGNTTNGSQIVTGIPSTSGMLVGDYVGLPGVALGTTIVSIDSGSQIHLSANATITASSAQMTIYRGTEVPVLPVINNPPLGIVEAYVRNDAIGGGDGSANDSFHALTWHEASAYSQGGSLGRIESWLMFGAAFDPTTWGGVAIYQNLAALSWAGDKLILGTDIQIESASDYINSKLGVVSDVAGTRRAISGLIPLPGPFTVSATINGVNIWTCQIAQYAGLYQDGAPMAKVLAASLGSNPSTIQNYGPDGLTLVPTSYTSANGALVGQPGSWWADDSGASSNLYFTTYDNSDPNVNGHAYGASLSFAGPAVIAASYTQDLDVKGYTPRLTNAGNLPNGEGGYVWLGNGVLAVSKNCDFSNGGKHVAGCLQDASKSKCVNDTATNIWGCFPEAWLSSPSGAASSWVSYSDGAGATAIEHAIGCNLLGTTLHVGSMEPQNSIYQVSLLTHCGDGSQPFSNITCYGRIEGGGINVYPSFQVLNIIAAPASIIAKTSIDNGCPVSVVRGSDYKARDGRALVFNFTGISTLIGGSASLVLKSRADGTTITLAGSVVSAGCVTVDVAASVTASLYLGNDAYAYTLVATLANGDVISLGNGSVSVL